MDELKEKYKNLKKTYKRNNNNSIPKFKKKICFKIQNIINNNLSKSKILNINNQITKPIKINETKIKIILLCIFKSIFK